ncbi:RING-type E3 ubiquitin transferase [Sarracenia purpurea var. burkii]
METLEHFIFFIFSILSIFTYKALCVNVCSPSSCGDAGPAIRFPFRLKNQQDDRCGYPGFDLSCNNQSQTVLTLPSAGEFTVNRIDYSNQWIFINDPDSCLPERIQNFSLSGSQFKGAFRRNYTFFNCSETVWSVPVMCLGSSNYSVIALVDYSAGDFVPPSCRNLSTVSVPVQLSSVNPSEDLQLTWKVPNCRACEGTGRSCGYVGDTGREIGCSSLPSRGLPRSAKYGIIIGAGIPGLICLIGFACYICSWIKTWVQQGPLDTEISNSVINLQPTGLKMGLDGPTIESYTKTVLGESRRLPKPSDGTCPICLGEYQPKETLRTIPECNHYFHINCIDEWLKMNATCPLCRNSPIESSVVTPSSVMSRYVSS